MKPHRKILAVAAVAGLASLGEGTAQTRFAVTSPTADPELMPSPITRVPAPLAAAAINPRPPAVSEPRGNPLWAIPLKALSATRESRYVDFESPAYQVVVPSADLE